MLATQLEDLPTRDQMLSMSGLDFMQKILAEELSGPPISGVLNYHLAFVAEGEVHFRGTPKFEHTNPLRTVHGGWYGTLMDSAMACSVMTTVPKGSMYTTLEFKVNITRALTIGTEVIVKGTIQHAGRTTAVAKGEMRGVEDGKLYATGSTTCLIMTP